MLVIVKPKSRIMVSILHREADLFCGVMHLSERRSRSSNEVQVDEQANVHHEMD